MPKKNWLKNKMCRAVTDSCNFTHQDPTQNEIINDLSSLKTPVTFDNYLALYLQTDRISTRLRLRLIRIKLGYSNVVKEYNRPRPKHYSATTSSRYTTRDRKGWLRPWFDCSKTSYRKYKGDKYIQFRQFNKITSNNGADYYRTNDIKDYQKKKALKGLELMPISLFRRKIDPLPLRHEHTTVIRYMNSNWHNIFLTKLLTDTDSRPLSWLPRHLDGA